MAQAKIFPFKDSVKIGWEIVKKNFWFFLAALIVLCVLSGLESFIPKEAVKSYPPLGGLRFILYVISLFFSLLLSLGLIKVALAFIDGGRPDFKELFVCSDKVINFFLASLLYGLIVLGGTILLIIPGIIWSLKFSLYKYFIVEKNAGPIEALKMSAQATAGAKWNLFLFGFVLAGINILGFLCLFIGLFFTIPLSWIAMAYVYRQLLAQTSLTAPAATTPAA